MQTQSQSITKTIKNKSNKKLKVEEEAQYQISINFSNNLLQTYIFEIYEKMKIFLHPNENLLANKNISNTLKISYKENIYYLVIIDKESLCNTISISESFIKENVPIANVTFVFLEIPNNTTVKIENETFSLEELIFFLNCEVRVKIVKCKNSSELVEYLQNSKEAYISKDEKSKISFFDAKPITNTNLCEIENITDENSLMLVKHLMCIPGISEKKAIAVVKVYPNLGSLMQIYSSNELNELEKENMLKDIEITDKGKNTKKRIGGVLSGKIYKTFFSINSSIII